MTEPAPAPSRPVLDPRRHPAAVAEAISLAWRPYRWRAYLTGLVAGLMAGGIAAPILTSSLEVALQLGGLRLPGRWPWFEVAWSVAFALTVPAVGAFAYARWQPRRLRMAAQAYLWLAARAEEDWKRVMGGQPLPRNEAAMRAVLATTPATPQTAGERFGLWMALQELDAARSAAAEMAATTPWDRFLRAGARWLVDFVAGTPTTVEPLHALAEAIDDLERRTEAEVTVALDRARVAWCEGRDWQSPLASAGERLGFSARQLHDRFLARPAFRTLLVSSWAGVAVFWVAMLLLGPSFVVHLPSMR